MNKGVTVTSESLGLGLFCCLLVGTPLFVWQGFHNPFVTAKFIFASAVLVVSLGLVTVRACVRGRLFLPSSYLWYVLCMFAGWCGLTLLYCPVLSLCARAVARHLAFLAVFFLAWLYLGTASRRRTVLVLVVVGALPIAALSILQYYGWDVLILPGIRVAGIVDLGSFVFMTQEEKRFKLYSLLGHRNYVAGYLCAVELLAIALFARQLFRDRSGPAERGGSGRGLSASLFFFALCALSCHVVVVLTHTRGAWAGLASGMVVLCFALGRLAAVLFRSTVERSDSASPVAELTGNVDVPPRKPPVPLAPVVVLVLSFLAVSILFGFVPGFNRMNKSVAGRMAEAVVLNKGSVAERMIFFRTAWRLIRSDLTTFLFGRGIGSFPAVHGRALGDVLAALRKEGLDVPDVHATWYVHNEILNYWVETGLVGVAMIAGLCLLLLSKLRDLWNLALKTGACEDCVFIAGAAAVFVAVLVHNLVSFSLHLPFTAFLFYALAGAVDRMSTTRPVVVDLSRRSRWLPAVTVSLLVLILVSLELGRVVESERRLKKSFECRNEGRLVESVIQSGEALRLSRGFPLVTFDFAEALRLAGFNHSSITVFAGLRPVLECSALEYDMGLAAEAAGMYDRAETCFRRALFLSPADSSTMAEYLLLLLRMGRYEQARRVWSLALHYRRITPKLLYAGGLLAMMEGSDDKAVAMLEDACKMNPEFRRAGALADIIRRFGTDRAEILSLTRQALRGTGVKDLALVLVERRLLSKGGRPAGGTTASR